LFLFEKLSSISVRLSPCSVFWLEGLRYGRPPSVWHESCLATPYTGPTLTAHFFNHGRPISQLPANTIHNHLHSSSNTIADFGETVSSLHLPTLLPQPPDPIMPSFTRPGSIRRRILRIISFGRYSNGSADDTQPLTRTNEDGRRYSAPDEVRPTYTAQESYQSSDSAQTTIIHEMPPGRAPFSISGLRDQHRGRYMSDTEFDTPPSLEATQQPTHPAGITRYAHPVETSRPTALLPEHTARNPTRLRRNKSFMQCNVCKRILEYTQFHCPGCAARTLHHVPGSPDSYTNSRDDDEPRILQPRTLQSRKRRQNEQHDISTEESSWDTQGLEAGTAEGSWATIAGDVEGVFAEDIHEEGLESSGIDEVQKQSEILCSTVLFCCKAGVTLIHHCCCGSSSTRDGASTCTRSCTVRVRPITAAVVLIFDESACKTGIHNRHIRCQILDERNISIAKDNQECCCVEGQHGGATKRKDARWKRWSKWLCCCC
jgi:hypothetical protein